MLGDDQRLRLGQIEDLARGVIRPPCRARAPRRIPNKSRGDDRRPRRGWRPAAAFRPCGRVERPASFPNVRAGCSSVAPASSSIRRSTAAWSCSNCSIRAAARVRRSAPSKPQSRPPAPEPAQPVLPWMARSGDSRIIRIVGLKTESAVQKNLTSRCDRNQPTWAVTIDEVDGSFCSHIVLARGKSRG